MAWNERVTSLVLRMALSQAWRTLARIKLLAGRHPLGRRVLVLRLSLFCSGLAMWRRQPLLLPRIATTTQRFDAVLLTLVACKVA